ncbi:putative antibiotic transporter [Pseudobythopirellula maris]|uniref:UPF0056 membrane protein n=1 Tax=Pseudobythopirellula maris TaxID=2527991 RepID=A0A5C5ZIX9_9BACT|nr:MarC family protein [Pseudobythopirellula maris]TWT87138.1 putative antibiotic transporter [Pseudobythopirellula maris]
MDETFLDAVVLMAVLFNPFLMSAYLHEVMTSLTLRVFTGVLLRAFMISGAAFFLFALCGERFFSDLLQVRFEAFQVFGGVLFLVIALKSITSGAMLIVSLRGTPGHMAGALAMPFMIGPGTVSASVIIGNRLPPAMACGAIATSLALSCVFLLLTKAVFDAVRKRNEQIIERYLEITGRVAALLIGTIAVDMIMRGVGSWIAEISTGGAA